MSLSLLMALFSIQTKAEPCFASSPSFLGISVAFSTRAYWAGPDDGCQPRERGWCLHISIDSRGQVPEGTIIGEISNLATTGLTLTFSKRSGVTPETFRKFFRNGKFNLEGEGTLAEEIAKKLGLILSYKISEGLYNFKEDSDQVTIFFKK